MSILMAWIETDNTWKVEHSCHVILLISPQLAALQLKLKHSHQKGDDAEKASLRAELERLRETRLDHEREALEVQQMLEEKLEELKAVTEDLYQSQDTVDKLQVGFLWLKKLGIVL